MRKRIVQLADQQRLPEDVAGLIFDVNPNAPGLLFEDAGKTIPATVGNIVSSLTESVAGISFTQAAANTQPILSASPTGYKYLEVTANTQRLLGDVVADTVIAPFIAHGVTVLVFCQMESAPTAAFEQIFMFGPTASGSGVHMFHLNDASGTDNWVFRRVDSGPTGRQVVAPLAAYGGLGSMRSLAVRVADGSPAFEAFFDGAYVGANTDTTAHMAGIVRPVIFANTAQASRCQVGAKFMRGLIYNRRLSGPEIAAIHAGMKISVGL